MADAEKDVGAGGGAAQASGEAAVPQREGSGGAPQGEGSSAAGRETHSAEGVADGSLLTEGLDSRAAEGGVSQGGAPGATREGDAEAGAEASADAVPERYELRMPEGWSLDEEGLAELTPVMRELKASNAQVQAVADVYVRRMSAAREAQIAAERETVKGWRKELREDPEIGGARFEENLAAVKKMLVKYGSEEFFDYLDDSSLGNYPPFVKVMVKVARELEDDRFVPGEGALPDDPASAAAKLIFDKSLKG